MGEAQLNIEWLVSVQDSQVDVDDVATGHTGGIAWRRDWAKKAFGSEFEHFFNLILEIGDR